MVRSQPYLISEILNGPLRRGVERRYLTSDVLQKIPCTPQIHLIEPSERSQCNKMSKYIKPSTRNKKTQEECIENSSALYGYFSEMNHGIPTDIIIPLNQNSCTTMPSVRNSGIPNTESEFSLNNTAHNHHNATKTHNQISQLALHPHNEQSAILDSTDLFIRDVATEVCSTIKWRSPNLAEVISFLDNPNSAIKANAAAYLQHLCYMDDPNKQRTRTLGGIPPLVKLLSSENYEVHKNACGALRNLSYGRQNDENKRAIKNAGGILALINLLCRATDTELKELVTGVIWNMSSCEDLKRFIIEDGLNAIVIRVIKPNSGWDPVSPNDSCFSTVFRNASGVLRNVSSAGEFARTMLRNSDYLVESLLYVVRTSIEKNNIGTKIVENCVCILRNLSYRCQEVEDPNYDKLTTFVPTLSPTKGKFVVNCEVFDTLLCFV